MARLAGPIEVGGAPLEATVPPARRSIAVLEASARSMLSAAPFGALGSRRRCLLSAIGAPCKPREVRPLRLGRSATLASDGTHRIANEIPATKAKAAMTLKARHMPSEEDLPFVVASSAAT